MSKRRSSGKDPSTIEGKGATDLAGGGGGPDLVPPTTSTIKRRPKNHGGSAKGQVVMNTINYGGRAGFGKLDTTNPFADVNYTNMSNTILTITPTGSKFTTRTSRSISSGLTAQPTTFLAGAKIYSPTTTTPIDMKLKLNLPQTGIVPPRLELRYAGFGSGYTTGTYKTFVSPTDGYFTMTASSIQITSSAQQRFSVAQAADQKNFEMTNTVLYYDGTTTTTLTQSFVRPMVLTGGGTTAGVLQLEKPDGGSLPKMYDVEVTKGLLLDEFNWTQGPFLHSQYTS